MLMRSVRVRTELVAERISRRDSTALSLPTRPHPLLRTIRLVLEEANRPLHISDIHEALENRSAASSPADRSRTA